MTEIQYDATSIQATPTDGAPLQPLSGTNVDLFVRAFDDTTEEFVTGKFQVPANFDTSGTVTVTVVVTAKTASSGKQVKHRFAHAAAVGNNETFDTTYTNQDSNDKEINAIQDVIVTHSWIMSSLGWGAGDTVFFKYSRINATSNLLGDMLLLNLVIKLPVV